jgi:hypothetical protein
LEADDLDTPQLKWLMVRFVFGSTNVDMGLIASFATAVAAASKANVKTFMV